MAKNNQNNNTKPDNSHSYHPIWEAIKYYAIVVLTAPIALIHAITTFIEKKIGIDTTKRERAADRGLAKHAAEEQAHIQIKDHLNPNFKEQLKMREQTAPHLPLDIVKVKSSVTELEGALYQFNVTTRNGLEYSIYADMDFNIKDSSICPEEIKVQMQNLLEGASLKNAFVPPEKDNVKGENVSDENVNINAIYSGITRTTTGIVCFPEPSEKTFCQAVALFRHETNSDIPAQTTAKTAKELADYIVWKSQHLPEQNIAVSYNGLYVFTIPDKDNTMTLTVTDMETGSKSGKLSGERTQEDVERMMKTAVSDVKKENQKIEKDRESRAKSKDRAKKREMPKLYTFSGLTYTAERLTVSETDRMLTSAKSAENRPQNSKELANAACRLFSNVKDAVFASDGDIMFEKKNQCVLVSGRDSLAVQGAIQTNDIDGMINCIDSVCRGEEPKDGIQPEDDEPEMFPEEFIPEEASPEYEPEQTEPYSDAYDIPPEDDMCL